MDTSSATGIRRFSILSLLVIVVMGLCMGAFLLAVAAFLAVLFIIMLYLGAKIALWVIGAMIVIFAGGL